MLLKIYTDIIKNLSAFSRIRLYRRPNRHKAPLLIMFVMITLMGLLGVLLGSELLVSATLYATLISSCIVYAMNIKKHILMAVFNGCVFLFLAGRFLNRSISGLPMEAEQDSVFIALILVMLSTIVINGVYLFLSSIMSEKKLDLSLLKKNKITAAAKKFVDAGFVITFCCAIIVSIGTLFYALENGYNSLYLGPDLGIPSFIIALGNMFAMFVALKLALMPSKRTVYLIFTTYFLTLIPYLLAGKRMAFMSAILVMVVYVVMRSRLENHWLGKKEGVAAALLVILVFLTIPLVGAARGGTTLSENPLTKTLDSQGVTLDVVSFGVQFEGSTPESLYGSYTFAPLADYLITNALSRFIFDTEMIPGQSIEAAEKGKDYPNALSYLVLADETYLSGQGLGSSYIIESYIDLGIPGVILCSVFIAFLISLMRIGFYRSYAMSFLTIYLMFYIFVLPRDSTLRFLVDMFLLQNIAALVMLYAVEYLNRKKVVDHEPRD